MFKPKHPNLLFTNLHYYKYFLFLFIEYKIKFQLCEFSLNTQFLQETIDKASETWMNKSCIVRGLKRLHQIEETPFLCTPKLTKTISLCVSNIIHLNTFSFFLSFVHLFIRFDEKMSTTPDETPSKKTKLNKSPNEPSSEKIDNISPKLSSEIKTLLHTPVIERKSKWNPGSVSSQYSTEALSLRRESTPQSILKVFFCFVGNNLVDFQCI